MKNIVIVLLLLVSVVLADLYFKQSHRAIKAEANAETLQQQVLELQSGVEKQEKKSARLRDQLENTRADVSAKAQETEQIKAALDASLTNLAKATSSAKTDSKGANPMSAFSEMFKNPEMKEMIKQQQKTALVPMIEKNYARLFADLHLTTEQSSALKEMLLNKQLGAADAGMALLSGDSDPAKRKEITQQIKAATDASDAQIKEFLGTDGFTQYQDYEKSMGERMTVNGLKDQLASGATALSDEQEQQLVQLMSQERKNFKFTTDLSDKTKFDGDFASALSEEKMTGYFRELDQLNQQYISKAQGVLTPDQLAAYEKQLKNQQAMAKMGMQMAAKMFAPASK